MNLISNTGIQLFTKSFEVATNESFKMFFHEWLEVHDREYKLEIAHHFSEADVWVKKVDLYYLGYVSKKNEEQNGRVIKRGSINESWDVIGSDFKKENKDSIQVTAETPEENGCFSISISKLNWTKFENVWLPLPYFLLKRKSHFGPTNWCRFKIIPLNKVGEISKYQILLAFDTRTEYKNDGFQNEDLNETPVFTNEFDKQKEYALCNDEILLLDYFSKHRNCEWVGDYLLNIYHDVKKIEELKIKKPKLKYLAEYICLLNYIQQIEILQW